MCNLHMEFRESIQLIFEWLALLPFRKKILLIHPAWSLHFLQDTPDLTGFLRQRVLKPTKTKYIQLLKQ